MGITLSKLVTAKKELDDLTTNGLRPRVFPSMGDSFEEEIRVISLKGGGR